MENRGVYVLYYVGSDRMDHSTGIQNAEYFYVESRNAAKIMKKTEVKKHLVTTMELPTPAIL